jgi:hypothetical protein
MDARRTSFSLPIDVSSRYEKHRLVYVRALQRIDQPWRTLRPVEERTRTTRCIVERQRNLCSAYISPM